jgi:hypothetical protein
MKLMVERIESLKAGIIGAFSLGLAFLITILLNILVLRKYFPTLAVVAPELGDLHFWLNGLIAGFSGLLFGVTYRYIIRSDQNSHLQAGAVWAFGLVRGLSQIEVGWHGEVAVAPYLILASESVFCFAVGAISLNTAISQGWLKPFGLISE